MRISKECDYALRIIYYLSMDKTKKHDAKDISQTLDMPHRFTVKILRKLCLAGYIESFRGVHGGYKYNESKPDINYHDIISCIDGPINVLKCLDTETHSECGNTGRCKQQKEIKYINNTIVSMLQDISFQ